MKKCLMFIFCLAAFYSQAQVDFTNLRLYVEFDTVQSRVDGEVELDFLVTGIPKSIAGVADSINARIDSIRDKIYANPDSRDSLMVIVDSLKSVASSYRKVEDSVQNRIDSIFLNGIDMDYHSVQLNGFNITYGHNKQGIWIKPDTTQLEYKNTLSIDYSAHPRKGLYFIGWNDTSGLSRRQIWTQGQGIDHRHWIPHKDDQTDKLIVDISVLFDNDYNVIANGRLDEHKGGAGQDLWRYAMEKPMSSYLIAIAIGDYDSTFTFSDPGIASINYYYPDREDDYQYYYHGNEEIQEFLQEEIGVPYPWQNYKQMPVQDFRHGAMENTGATIFGDFFLVDQIAFNDQNYTHVNAHELAHQWFGNLVTAQSSIDHWLHEGFATYYQWLSEKNLYGQDYFDWERYKAAEMVAQASKAEQISLGNKDAGSSRFYQKGGWILHMLSERLGREDFRKAIKQYLNDYEYGIVTTDSLKASILKATGFDAGQFFDQWVRTPAEPVIRVKHGTVSHDTLLHIDVEQDSSLSLYPFDIKAKLELVYSGGYREEKTLHLNKAVHSFDFRIKKDTVLEYWNFDPGMNILGLVGESKPFRMSKSQLSMADRLLDRYEALLYVGAEDWEKKKDLLVDVFQDTSEHFAVRAEALKHLVEGKHPESRKFILSALRDHDVQLQKEAIKYVPGESDEETRDVLAMMRHGRSYQLREMAIHASIDRDEAEKNEWLYDTAYVLQPGIPGHNVHITSLLYRVALFKGASAFKQLVKYTSPSYDFMTRINAMAALKALDLVSEDLVENLFDAYFNTNWKLRREARDLLMVFYREKNGKKMIEKFLRANEHQWDARRRNTVNRIFERNPN